MPTAQTCETCKYLDNSLCRRLPPQCAGIIPQKNLMGETVPAVIAAFPNTQPDSWCGEYIFKSKITLE